MSQDAKGAAPTSRVGLALFACGRDGFLSLSLGHGGGARNTDLGPPPLGNGQDRMTLLGSILCVDVDTMPNGQAYAIPADNPFVGQPGGDEIFAYGFRNPDRIFFDLGGEHGLLGADVGQALFEEVNLVERGQNYGWNIMEGSRSFSPEIPQRPSEQCADRGPFGRPLVAPIL